jgi:hypothetical protein
LVAFVEPNLGVALVCLRSKRKLSDVFVLRFRAPLQPVN